MYGYLNRKGQGNNLGLNPPPENELISKKSSNLHAHNDFRINSNFSHKQESKKYDSTSLKKNNGVQNDSLLYGTPNNINIKNKPKQTSHIPETQPSRKNLKRLNSNKESVLTKTKEFMNPSDSDSDNWIRNTNNCKSTNEMKATPNNNGLKNDDSSSDSGVQTSFYRVKGSKCDDLSSQSINDFSSDSGVQTSFYRVKGSKCDDLSSQSINDFPSDSGVQTSFFRVKGSKCDDHSSEFIIKRMERNFKKISELLDIEDS